LIKTNVDEDEVLICTPNPTYIYAVECSNTRYIKIGISTSPKNRRNILQIGTPHRLNLLRTWGPWLAEEARYVEKVLHDKFAPKKQRGEWFSVSLNSIDKELVI
jgi:hypothetical protein